MLKLMNLTNTQGDLERFAGEHDLRNFIAEHGLNGIEVLPFAGNDLGFIPTDLVPGLHLSYFPAWVDFWNGDEQAALKEFDDQTTMCQHYGGQDRSAIMHKFQSQLDLAHELGVKYVVFHVSDVSLTESVDYKFLHTDRQVIDASCALLNILTAHKPYRFEILLENLWWPGLTMTRPEMTERLLSGIDYAQVGIMLDAGHLLHTNTSIRTQEQGIEYIHRCLDEHEALAAYIRGVHLHQSTSGSYVENMLQNPPSLQGSYFERLGQAYEFILNIDTHRPFTGVGIEQLIERINPKYLVYEFITSSRAQHSAFLHAQAAALAGL